MHLRVALLLHDRIVFVVVPADVVWGPQTCRSMVSHLRRFSAVGSTPVSSIIPTGDLQRVTKGLPRR